MSELTVVVASIKLFHLDQCNRSKHSEYSHGFIQAVHTSSLAHRISVIWNHPFLSLFPFCSRKWSSKKRHFFSWLMWVTDLLLVWVFWNFLHKGVNCQFQPSNQLTYTRALAWVIEIMCAWITKSMQCLEGCWWQFSHWHQSYRFIRKRLLVPTQGRISRFGATEPMHTKWVTDTKRACRAHTVCLR
jgi:hypothetical protein